MSKETGGFVVLCVIAFLIHTVWPANAQMKDGVMNSPHAKFTTTGPVGIQMNGDVSVTGNVTAGSFTGDGSGLTNIPGTAISNTSITVDQLQNNAVTQPKIADGAVTPGKISFYSNMCIVAKNGGDFSDPAQAMSTLSSCCPAPSAATPCLLKIMPGVYQVAYAVEMRPYMDIEGSGEHTTIIQGSIDSLSSGVVNGAGNAEIRFLTVKNSGGGANAIALYNASAPLSIMSVTAAASGSTQSFGVYNDTSGAVKISNSAIKGTTSTVHNGSGAKAFVGTTQLDGGTVSNLGTLTCVGAYDTNYVALGTNCQ